MYKNNIMVQICVLMWYDSTMEKYGDVNYEINKRYCDRYGYDIIKSNVRHYTDRTPHWERLPFILSMFDKYDYIIWIDADAHFYIDSPPITKAIDEYPEKTFIVSMDVDDPQYDRNVAVNSGFFITKTTADMKMIFTEWMENKTLYDERYGFTVGNDRGLFQDQGILRLMLDKNLFGMRNKTQIVEYGILQFFPGVEKKIFPNAPIVCEPIMFGLNRHPFVCHWSKYNADDRYNNSKMYLNFINCDKN